MNFGRVDTIIEKGVLKGVFPYQICTYLEYLKVADIATGPRKPDYPALILVIFGMEPLPQLQFKNFFGPKLDPRVFLDRCKKILPNPVWVAPDNKGGYVA
jgi:hypothetical protein